MMLKASEGFVASIINLHREAARKAGISDMDYSALRLFSFHGSMTAGELASRTGLTTGAVTGLIARLKAKGFIWRTFDPADFRRVILEPNTGRISAVTDPAEKAFRAGTKKMFAKMSTRDFKVLELFFGEFSI